MNCEGEGAPTRQNIKSHLQKYRLLMQKRAEKGGAEAASGGDSRGEVESKATAGHSHMADSSGNDVENELEQHLQKQEMNLRVQMDIQQKLHRQVLLQRQLQHQLEHCFPTSAEQDDIDQQRYHATLQLKNSLRERLTKQSLLQQVPSKLLRASQPQSRVACQFRPTQVLSLMERCLEFAGNVAAPGRARQQRGDQAERR